MSLSNCGGGDTKNSLHGQSILHTLETHGPLLLQHTHAHIHVSPTVTDDFSQPTMCCHGNH